MEAVVSSYFPVLVFLAIACALSFIMIVAPFILAKLKPDAEKLSPYECGEEPVGGTFINISLASRAKINPFDLPRPSGEISHVQTNARQNRHSPQGDLPPVDLPALPATAA